ncbi:hypothetical protein FRY98_24650 [Paenibacillus faecis]|uniref:Uncharacterized protein n=1 Tax=Paenibacillus faecis TaxID=862114 RepID=A0A5D0CLR1_9BACL|nr:hypothetical protein [Paenibacillus faecis]TYA10959.1 hypothetical protein FRY98_24650 [Paenibacillus faecis]
MPKVLITNGSVVGTWYEGKAGMIYDVSFVSNTNYMLKENDLPSPFHRGVRKEDGELLYTEAEYNEILRQRDKAIDDLAKHAKEMADLIQGRQILLETIEKAAGEQELVELPREVAEALKDFKEDGRDIDEIIHRMLDVHTFGSDRLTVIRSYASENGWNFISALVNGYTIEQTPAERFQADVQTLLKDWLGSNLDEKLIDQLTSQIVEHAQQQLQT